MTSEVRDHRPPVRSQERPGGATTKLSPNWVALSREAGTSAEHLAIGVTALGRANYAQQAYYGQAFFALSVGFERAAKLILVLNHLVTRGAFPTNADIRQYGHGIRQLLDQLELISTQYGLTSPERSFPHSPVHDAIIDVLTKFADNTTRYYNLDLLTGSARIADEVDPIAHWWSGVLVPIISALPQRRLRKVTDDSGLVAALLHGSTITLHITETGETSGDVFDLSLRTGLTQLACRQQQVYVLQIVRAISALMDVLSLQARELQLDIPYLSEFYAIYNNSDAYFRSRSTWSIYRP